MNLQQKFGERLLSLLNEKNISQGEFAEKMNCSRQSINFYILGKRSPDITLAAEMAKLLGVSCDYLIGFSDFRNDIEGNITVKETGISEDTMKFFAGLKIMSEGNAAGENTEYSMNQANISLSLLNALISHEAFGVLLQYIKRYRDVRNSEDVLSQLKNFMIELESPSTGNIYGNIKENKKMVEDFCLHVVSKYMDEIVRDIAECI